MMEFKKKGSKGEDTEFKWNGEVIKMEKVAKYLGYILQSNNGGKGKRHAWENMESR